VHQFRMSVIRVRVQRILLGMLVALCGGATSSCTGPGSDHGNITIAVALLPSEGAAYARILEEFSDSTGIGVELVVQQYQQIREALRAEAAAGFGQLDVVEFDVYFLPDVATLVQPLDSLMHTLAGLREAVPADAWNAGVNLDSSRKVLFVPHRLNWQAMIYDAKRLVEPPQTWEDLRLLAQNRPASIGIKGARYEGLVCDFFPFLWQAGGEILDPRSPAALTALKFFAEIRSGIHPGSISFKENTVLQAQEHQEILLHFNWPYVLPLLRSRGLLPGSIRSAPLPAGPHGSATVLGGGYVGVPRTAPHPMEAARLLEFLTSETTQRRLLKELGWFPPRASAWGELDEKTRQEAGGFIAMKDQVRARPLVQNYDKISVLWQTAVAQVIFEGEDPERALHNLSLSMDDLGPRASTTQTQQSE
jgi:ABC-type glycerol-3-phosphate transport system substrate-binding protein